MVVVQGLLGYGISSVYGAIPAEIFQSKQYGTIYGTLSVASNLGAGIGPWVTGLVYDQTGTYMPAFWLAIGLCFVSIGSMWMAAPRKVRLVPPSLYPSKAHFPLHHTVAKQKGQ